VNVIFFKSQTGALLFRAMVMAGRFLVYTSIRRMKCHLWLFCCIILLHGTCVGLASGLVSSGYRISKPVGDQSLVGQNGFYGRATDVLIAGLS